jgi:DNA polymerase III subunit delta
VADLKPVYLISGDDDPKIDAWRARVRSRAEDEHGPGALETFDARETAPDELASALATLTFSTGTRYLLVEDAGAWKAAQLEPLIAALKDMPPDTVLVLVVRGKPLKQLAQAVEAAGGESRDYAGPKPWEMPKWVVARAQEEGLQLDQDTAKELVASVGGGPQRLAREIEKLAVALHPSTHVSPEDVAALSSGDGAPPAYELADALIAGDLARTLAIADELEAHGERPGRLVYGIARRLREVHRAASLLEAGVPEQKAAEALKAPPWLAKKTLAKAKKADRRALERALAIFADFEVEARGGGNLDEDTAFSLALSRAAA